MSAPPEPVTVGNEATSATMRSGTIAPSTYSGTTEPICWLLAFMNALVAMAGMDRTRASCGSSTSWAATC